MKTDNRVEIYQEWAKAQNAAWKRVYADIDGKLPDDAKIPLWHKTHFGGHASAVVCGLSRWSRPSDIYSQMLNPQDDRISNFAMRRGTHNEPFIAKEVERVLMTKVRKGRGFRTDSKRPWSTAQIDYTMTDVEGYTTVLEIKTGAVNPTQPDGTKLWGKGCVIVDGKVVNKDDLVPVEYFVQVQKQLYLTKKKYGYLAVWLTYENGIRIYRIDRDDALIQKIVDAEDDFLFNHLIPKVPIPVVEERSMLEEQSDDAVFADADIASAVKRLQVLKAQIAELKDEEKELVDIVKTGIGEHKTLINRAGDVLAKLSAVVKRTFDTTTFKKENPEMYGKYIVEKKESPRLTITALKADEL